MVELIKISFNKILKRKPDLKLSKLLQETSKESVSYSIQEKPRSNFISWKFCTKVCTCREFPDYRVEMVHLIIKTRLVQLMLYESDTDHERKMVKYWRVQVLIICWSLNAETTDSNSPFYLLVFCPKSNHKHSTTPFLISCIHLSGWGGQGGFPQHNSRNRRTSHRREMMLRKISDFEVNWVFLLYKS